MDWIRRNWPDLLIGVALVAVIAMIVATLLSGGSLNSLLRRGTAPDIPITNTTGASNSGQTTETPDDTPAQNPDTSGEQPAAANGTAGGGTAQSGDLDVFVPGTAEESDTAAQAGSDTTENATGQNANATPATGAGAAATSTTGAGSVNEPLPESVINGGFRVAAGAVDSRDGALAAAQTLRDAGYTVTVEPQGDLYLLWIGPYASDAGAERVASRLQTDGLVPDALVYTYDPDEANAAAGNAGAGNGGTGNGGAGNGTPAAQAATDDTNAAGAGNANAGNGPTTPATTTGTAATPADADLVPPAGQRFLQVGAYRSDESAEPQRTQLEGLGLTVTSDEDASGIVRLYVGPFADAQLAQTQNRLTNQGIDSFPVTP